MGFFWHAFNSPPILQPTQEVIHSPYYLEMVHFIDLDLLTPF